jgi:hypothetical protein
VAEGQGGLPWRSDSWPLPGRLCQLHQLLHGNKTYLIITSLIRLAAVAAGMEMLITASDVGLTVVMAAVAVLWLIATIHHSLLAKSGLPQHRQGAGDGQLDCTSKRTGSVTYVTVIVTKTPRNKPDVVRRDDTALCRRLRPADVCAIGRDGLGRRPACS